MKIKTKNEIERELIDEGFDINVHRFPYTYHHDYVRLAPMSRSDAAQKLKCACIDENRYDFSACYGAILYLIREQPEKITPGVCDTLEYVRDGSIYNVEVCGLDQMRKIIKIDD